MLDYLMFFYVIGIVSIVIPFTIFIWRYINNRKFTNKKPSLFLIAFLICLDTGLGVRIAAVHNVKSYGEAIKPEKNVVPLYIESNSSIVRTKEEISKNTNAVIFIKSDNSFNLGAIVNSSGYVISNYHSIAKSIKFTGVFQNNNKDRIEEIPMDLVAFDQDLDIALLKLRDERNFNYLYFGDSEKTTNNEKITTIGCSKEGAKIVSEGLISKLESIGNYKNIRISAQESSSSSGGALFNSMGEIIGLITYSEHNGENLALPSREIMKFLDKYSTIQSIKNYCESKDVNSKSEKNAGDSYDNYNFILPYSSERKLKSDEIKNFNIYILGMARNEIYARHGYIFTIPQYSNYFNTKSWYKQNSTFNEKELSDIEKYNILLIYKREQQLKGE